MDEVVNQDVNSVVNTVDERDVVIATYATMSQNLGDVNLKVLDLKSELEILKVTMETKTQQLQSLQAMAGKLVKGIEELNV